VYGKGAQLSQLETGAAVGAQAVDLPVQAACEVDDGEAEVLAHSMARRCKIKQGGSDGGGDDGRAA
jgi:hypothetical protein